MDSLHIPPIPMKPIVILHFVLLAWATQFGSWLLSSYTWTNILVLLLGFWTLVDRDGVEAVQWFFFGMCFTFLNDIIVIANYFDSNLADASSYYRFAAAMVIINIILKPLSMVFIAVEYKSRGGAAEYGGGNPNWGGPRAGTYERLDGRTASPIPPQPQGPPPHLQNNPDTF